jgi:hypothetical protein
VGVPLATQAAIFRDLFGNPFRPVPALLYDRQLPGSVEYRHPWLAWNDGTVPKLAQALYDGRRFEDLPILADALEDAGYTDPPGRTAAEVIQARKTVAGCCHQNADNRACDCLERGAPEGILAHLRGPGPHARGCWVVDLLLGKE